jgi:transcriptional regulator with XRE-family HTH domain
MNMHEFVITRLTEWRYRRPEIARETGISLRTIEKIARQEVKNPGIKHMQTLHDFFQARDSGAAA